MEDSPITEKANTSQNKNNWLDLCRALAITLVLFGHGRYFLTPAFKIAEALAFAAYLGVELFFVLSGFLIGRIILKNIISSPHNYDWLFGFWIRRWLRTVPNYLLFISINLFLLYSGIRIVAPPDLLTYIIFFQNFAWPHPSFLPEAWSLSVEEIFYIAAPILFIISTFYDDKLKTIIYISIAVMAISILLRLYVVLQFNPTWDDGIRKITIFRFDALMTGVLLSALLHSKGKLIFPKKPAATFSLFLIPCIYMASLSPQWLDKSITARTLLFTLTSMGCGGFIMLGLNSKIPVLCVNYSSFIAKISYSAYLSNLPVAWVIIKYFGFSGHILGSAFRFTIYIIVTIVISRFVYRFIESPILSWRDKISPPKI